MQFSTLIAALALAFTAAAEISTYNHIMTDGSTAGISCDNGNSSPINKGALQMCFQGFRTDQWGSYACGGKSFNRGRIGKWNSPCHDGCASCLSGAIGNALGSAKCTISAGKGSCFESFA